MTDPALTAEAVRLYDAADMAWRRGGPGPDALRALGVRERSLAPLAGGAGYCWTDGRLVLKPVGNTAEHDWVCDVYAAWTSADVRVPEPVAPTSSAGAARWSYDGWAAHVMLLGRDLDLETELPRVQEASDAFHHALRDVPRPAFLDVRNDPWAYGDRVAWEGVVPVGDPLVLDLVARLITALRPLDLPEQPVHGDVLPNVLAADGLPLGVIDWPVYFRPAGTGNAIAVTDAVVLRGAPIGLLEEWGTGADWHQLLLRALLYRLGATGLISSRNRLMGNLVTHAERAAPVVDHLLAHG